MVAPPALVSACSQDPCPLLPQARVGSHHLHRIFIGAHIRAQPDDAVNPALFEGTHPLPIDVGAIQQQQSKPFRREQLEQFLNHLPSAWQFRTAIAWQQPPVANSLVPLAEVQGKQQFVALVQSGAIDGPDARAAVAVSGPAPDVRSPEGLQVWGAQGSQEVVQQVPMVGPRLPLAATVWEAVHDLLHGKAEETQHSRILEQEPARLVNVGDVEQRHDCQLAQERFFRHITLTARRGKQRKKVEKTCRLHQPDELVKPLGTRVDDRIVLAVHQRTVDSPLVVTQEAELHGKCSQDRREVGSQGNLRLLHARRIL